jgi:TPR repeat protein
MMNLTRRLFTLVLFIGLQFQLLLLGMEVKIDLPTAAKKNLMPEVLRLLQSGVDVNTPDEKGFTALHWAAKNNRKKIIAQLLMFNADINAITKKGKLPWQLAKENGNDKILQILKGVGGANECGLCLESLHDEAKEVVRISGNCVHLLHASCRSDLMTHNNVNKSCPLCKRPIVDVTLVSSHSSKASNGEQNSLKNGEDIPQPSAPPLDEEVSTAHELSTRKSLTLPSKLIGDVEKRELAQPEAPSKLFLAVAHGSIQDLEIVIQKEIEGINQQDIHGATALHIAVQNDSIDALRILLEQGANPTIVDMNRRTPLDRAVEKGDEHMVALLLKYQKMSDEEPSKAECFIFMGKCFFNGEGVRNDHEKARRYFEKAERQSGLSSTQVEAWWWLGEIFREGRGIERDAVRAGQYYQRVSDQPRVPNLQAQASYRLGEMHRVGEFGNVNVQLAREYLMKASEQIHEHSIRAAAWVSLGQLRRLEKKYDEAFCYYEKALQQTDNRNALALALKEVGDLCFFGLGNASDFVQARKFYEMALTKDAEPEVEAEAWYMLGEICYKGLDGKLDTRLALECFEKAERSLIARAKALCRQGIIYHRGVSGVVNFEKAREYYNRAAEQTDCKEGQELALCRLAVMYYNGEGVEKNYSMALQGFERAEKQSDSLEAKGCAWRCLGDAYYDGFGVTKNLDLACDYYKKAAEQTLDLRNQAYAALCLGIMYFDGVGVNKDYLRARQYCEQAANQTFNEWACGRALRILGYICYKGQDGYGVEQNRGQAHSYFMRAAMHTDDVWVCVDSLRMLADGYHYGRGVPIDYRRARECYEQADSVPFKIFQQDNGYARAGVCMGLGDIYYCGQGIDQDYGKALSLYVRAADQNDNLWVSGWGSYRSGEMRYRGQGGPKNYEVAYAYLKRAACQNDHMDAQTYALQLLPDCLVELMKVKLDLGDFDGIGKLLLDNEPLLSKSETVTKFPALHIAAEKGYKAVVEVLISKGISTTQDDKHGKNALFYAMLHGHEVIAELLIKSSRFSPVLNNCFKVDAKDKIDDEDVNLMEYAVIRGYCGIVKLLIDLEYYDIKQAISFAEEHSRSYISPMHIAAAHGHDKIVEIFLDHGAPINSYCKRGWTALHLAARNGKKEVVQLLVKRKADVTLEEECYGRGRTARQVAVGNGHKEVASILEKAEESCVVM